MKIQNTQSKPTRNAWAFVYSNSARSDFYRSQQPSLEELTEKLRKAQAFGERCQVCERYIMDNNSQSLDDKHYHEVCFIEAQHEAMEDFICKHKESL